MNRVYLAHDDVLGDDVTMASGVALGGHVHVGAGANLGLGAIVHQRRVIGPGAMVGMGAVVTRDVPPYALAHGNPCRVRDANRVGLARAGVADDAIDELSRAYVAGLVPSSPPSGLSPQAWRWWAAETGSRPV
jgi:UDP-N-acetylglucosamine acyltransferase